MKTPRQKLSRSGNKYQTLNDKKYIWPFTENLFHSWISKTIQIQRYILIKYFDSIQWRQILILPKREKKKYFYLWLSNLFVRCLALTYPSYNWKTTNTFWEIEFRMFLCLLRNLRIITILIVISKCSLSIFWIKS